MDFGFWISAPKSKIQNPQGPKIQNPKSPRSKVQNPPKIQNPKSPKSKIQNPQDPKSKIPKIPHPKSSAKIQNLGRWGPHIKNCYITIQNPRSKIQNPQIADFGDFGFWNLDLGDFGFWIVGILDFGDFGVWILGILDFGDFGFWGFWILDFGDFGAFGEVQGCTTRQFGDGAWEVRGSNPPWSAFQGQCKTNSIWYSWSKKANWASETGATGSKDYILHIFSRGSEARICCDLPSGPLQNQLYLIELAQERKLSYRDHCSTSISVPKSKSTVSNIVGKG